MEDIVLRELSAEIKMPNQLAIGDDKYIDDYKNNANVVYVKNYRGKSDWVGKVKLQEVDCGDGYIQIVLRVGYGVDINDATLRSTGGYYKSESAKEHIIGLDTATLYIGVGKEGYNFVTNADGLNGSVFEFKKCNKLTGIHIDLVLDDGNNYGFESIKSKVEYLFNCKLV